MEAPREEENGALAAARARSRTWEDTVKLSSKLGQPSRTRKLGYPRRKPEGLSRAQKHVPRSQNGNVPDMGYECLGG